MKLSKNGPVQMEQKIVEPWSIVMETKEVIGLIPFFRKARSGVTTANSLKYNIIVQCM